MSTSKLTGLLITSKKCIFLESGVIVKIEGNENQRDSGIKWRINYFFFKIFSFFIFVFFLIQNGFFWYFLSTSKLTGLLITSKKCIFLVSGVIVKMDEHGNRWHSRIKWRINYFFSLKTSLFYFCIFPYPK